MLPPFSKVSGSAPFPRVMSHWPFSKGWSIVCTSLPFFKGLLLPKFLSKLFFAIAHFPKVCGCFPADTLFQRYLKAGSMRCEGLCQAMQSL